MEAIPIPNDITIIIYRSFFFFLTSGTGTQWCDGGWRSQSAEFNSPAPAPEFIGGGTDTYWWWSWCRKWWWWQWCLNAWIISKDSNPNRNVRFAELSMYSITRYLIPERILRKVKYAITGPHQWARWVSLGPRERRGRIKGKHWILVTLGT